MARKKILGFDVVWFNEGRRVRTPFRNKKLFPTRYGNRIPDITEAKIFAVKKNATRIITMYDKE